MGNWMTTLGHQLDGNFQSAVDFYEKIGNVAVDPYYSKMGTLWLGVSYFLNGQFKEAEGPLNEFVTYSKLMGCEIMEYMALMFLSEAIQIFKECEMEGFLKQAREAMENIK